MAGEPVFFGRMKLTMNIDDDLLREIMHLTGARTRAKAVEIALRELARRHDMRTSFAAGLGMTPEELRRAFDPASLAALLPPARLAAEPPSPYAKTDPPGH